MRDAGGDAAPAAPRPFIAGLTVGDIK